MTKISALEAIPTVQPADELVVVDVDDISMASTGTTKKMTLAQAQAVDWINAVTQYAVIQSSESAPVDTTTTMQAAFNGAVAADVPLYLPAGIYAASSLTIPAGLILHGAFSGTYPGENTIPAVTEIMRLAGTNTDLLTAPDGNNYFQIFDIAIAGNGNNNTAGQGLVIADGAAGQECQAVIERCFIHDNPGSNVYLGNNRRGNKVQFGCFNYSRNGDGITVCGSDNLIMSNIVGSNARAGINLGSTVSQNWSSFGSNLNSTTTHVFNNDIYQNEVGIAVPSNVTRSMIVGNGIDRNTKQGITVYNVDCNMIIGNALHSNGQATDNTYAHIDIASGVTGVVIDDNTFGPVDGGITNLCTTCVNIASFSTTGVITGNIGQADASSPDTHSGLINSQSNTPPATRLSNAGALIQGSGNDILNLRNSGGTTVTKVTQGGSFVHTGGGAQYTTAQNVMGSATALATAVLSLVGTATGTAQLKTQLFSGQTADIWDMYASNGSTLLASITAAALAQFPAFAASGLTGATAASRYVGAIASGTAPASGTFSTGDWMIVQSGGIIVCTAGGTSGTWVAIGGGSGTVTSVTAGDTSIVVGGTGAAPTIETGTLDVIAADHPPAGNWSNNSNKITSLANGSSAQDAAAYGQTLAGGSSPPLTTLGDLLYENATPAPARLAGNTTAQKEFLSQTGTGSVSAAPAWSVVSGMYLCAPVQVAPSPQVNYQTASATLAAVTPAATTVAAGSNGGEVSQVATWSSPSAGVLDVATVNGWPAAGTFTVATSTTTATCTYTGTAAGQLTGVAYVSGSATGTVSTGGAVTLTSSAIYTGPFNAPASGDVVVAVSLSYNGSSNDVVAFSLADHASLSSLRGNVISCDSNSVTNAFPSVLQFLVTGLTAGTSYNFDLLFAIAAAGTLSIRAFGQSTTTPTGANGAPVLVTVQAV